LFFVIKACKIVIFCWAILHRCWLVLWNALHKQSENNCSIDRKCCLHSE